MNGKHGDSVAPITSGDRVGELDVLRGFALLGVLIVNFTGWLAPPFLATDAQYEALTASQADSTAAFAIRWLAYDKANTLFAFLFGIGFWIQMQRLEAKRADAIRVYTRRLAILLAIGLLHLLLIWPWDFLHLYALVGFGLLMLRNRSDRFFLVAGLLLAVVARPVIEYAFEVSGISGPAFDRVYADSAILARQGADSFWELNQGLRELVLFDWIASGLIVGWMAYALGRFLLGAYVARKGWIQRSAALLPQFRLCLLICLPLGLLGQFVATGLEFESYKSLSRLNAFEKPLHYVSLIVLLAGYVSMIVVLFRSVARPLVMIFAPVGRMALTNYVAQSFVIAFLSYQALPGPDFAGTVGPFMLLIYAICAFAVQIILSKIWLSYFAFGPLEWCWRALTYGQMPKFRKQP